MKNQIREEMKIRRKAMTREDVFKKSKDAAECLMKSDIYKAAKVIMLYMPLGNETDTTELVEAAINDGKQVVLPVTQQETGIITPCYYQRNTVLEKGGFSVREPKNSDIAEKSELDVVIVPGIAFDESGARVGFGKGCYDMFLNGIRAVKVGFCYGFQVVERIPADEHDIKMDFIVTEDGMKKCR